MPDFENVVVRVPYEADVVLGRERRRVRIDEAVEIPIPSLASEDTQRVLMAKMIHEGHDLWIDFVEFEGKLFRPYFRDGHRHLWTSDRCKAMPPPMNFSAHWGHGHARTTMLGSPFRPSAIDVPKAYIRQAQKSGREALNEARSVATRTAQSGMIFVDDLLHFETSAPGFGVHTDAGRKRAGLCLPDYDEKPGATLIDVTLPFDEVEDVLWRMRVGTPSIFEVIDPALLPKTTERDALACFAVNLLQNLDDLRVFDRRLVTDVLIAANGVEDALRNGLPLAPCYDAIERLAAWRGPDERGAWFAERTSVFADEIVGKARLFLDLKRALPPRSDEPAPAEGLDADADVIAQGFGR